MLNDFLSAAETAARRKYWVITQCCTSRYPSKNKRNVKNFITIILHHLQDTLLIGYKYYIYLLLLTLNYWNRRIDCLYYKRSSVGSMLYKPQYLRFENPLLCICYAPYPLIFKNFLIYYWKPYDIEAVPFVFKFKQNRFKNEIKILQYLS